MKWLVIFAVFAIAPLAHGQDFSRQGPFAVSQREVIITRTNSSTFGALLFYPATKSATNALPDRRGAPYPIVSFGHGFMCPPALYAVTMRHLASWGFIVIATESALELFPSHAEYASDMRLCLHWLAGQGAQPAGDWSGLISSNRWGISGHSMGGGAGILAAADEPAIRAVANMAAAETRPSAIDSIARIRAPVCLIAGSQDALVPPDKHTHPMYENANTPRLFPLILGGSHCGFVDVPLPDFACDEGALPRPVQLAQSRALLAAFFRLYLCDDTSAWSFVWGPALALNPLIRTETDPGFSLSPSWQSKTAAGSSATFTLSLINTETTATRFRFGASGNTSGLTFTPPITGILPPGATTNVIVNLSLPAGQRRAFTIITAQPESDGRTRDFSILGIDRR